MLFLDEIGIAVGKEMSLVFVATVAVVSTGFLERFLPLCMCLSQYLESVYASFEHLHFLPSVLLHLPGSGSIFLPNPIWKQFHPTAKKQFKKKKKHIFTSSREFKFCQKKQDGCVSVFIYWKKESQGALTVLRLVKDELV